MGDLHVEVFHVSMQDAGNLLGLGSLTWESTYNFALKKVAPQNYKRGGGGGGGGGGSDGSPDLHNVLIICFIRVSPPIPSGQLRTPIYKPSLLQTALLLGLLWAPKHPHPQAHPNNDVNVVSIPVPDVVHGACSMGHRTWSMESASHLMKKQARPH